MDYFKRISSAVLKRVGFVFLLFGSISILLGNIPSYAQFDIIWQQIYGSADQNYPGRAIELSTGNILVAGTVSYFEPTSDIEVTLLSSMGDSITTVVYGGTLPVGAYDVFRMMDNRCVVAGYGVTEDTGESDVKVITTTPAGILEDVSDVVHDDNDVLRDGAPTLNNQILLAGNTEGGPSAIDFFVARLDSELQTIWMRRIANVGSSRDEANCVIEMNASAIFVAGSTTRNAFPFNENLYIVKLDADGDSLWSLEFGDDAWEEIITMERLNDHQLVFAANYSFDGNSEILVTCMDTSGSICWQTPVGLPEIEELASDILVTDSHILVLGTRTGFDGIPVILLAAMSFQGDTIWTQTISGDVGFTANSIEKTANDDFLICGTTYSLAVPPEEDAVLIRLALGSGTETEQPGIPSALRLSAYPNPFNGSAQISVVGPAGTFELSLHNVIGQRIATEEITIGMEGRWLRTSVLSNETSGVYFLSITGQHLEYHTITLIKMK